MKRCIVFLSFMWLITLTGLSQETETKKAQNLFVNDELLREISVNAIFAEKQYVGINQQGSRNTTQLDQISLTSGQRNAVNIFQRGRDNLIDIESVGGNHNIAAQQWGNLNTISQQIKTSVFNNSIVVQKGNGNTGNLSIDGSYNEVRIETKGNDNAVGTAREISVKGDHMRTWIQQLGDFNEVDACQEGDLQQASITQKGDFNVLSLQQKNFQKDISGNAVYLEQNGSTNNMRVQQSGNNSNMFVLQEGTRNQLELELLEDEVKGSISQLGNQNLLLQKISGRGQEYEIIQEGNNNLLIQSDNREQAPYYKIHQKGNGMKLILENTQMVSR